jgi:hypothetical protein
MQFDINEEKKRVSSGKLTLQRTRRTANEIKRHYRCMVDECTKSYGSEGSLNQHIKLKHPQYFKEEMQGNPQHHHAHFQHIRD